MSLSFQKIQAAVFTKGKKNAGLLTGSGLTPAEGNWFVCLFPREMMNALFYVEVKRHGVRVQGHRVEKNDSKETRGTTCFY